MAEKHILQFYNTFCGKITLDLGQLSVTAAITNKRRFFIACFCCVFCLLGCLGLGFFVSWVGGFCWGFCITSG